MEAALIEALKQVPALAVLTYLVITGLKQVTKITSNFTETLKALEGRREDSLKVIRGDCHGVQKANMEVLTDVRDALHKNTEMLGFVCGRTPSSNPANPFPKK